MYFYHALSYITVIATFIKAVLGCKNTQLLQSYNYPHKCSKKFSLKILIFELRKFRF